MIKRESKLLIEQTLGLQSHKILSYSVKNVAVKGHSKRKKSECMKLAKNLQVSSQIVFQAFHF